MGGRISTHRIKIQSLAQTLDAPSDSTLLESMLDAGIDYPHGCVSGLCSLCKSRLISGAVTHLDYFASALSDEEKDAGLVLPCRALPSSDCVITPVQHDANLPPVTTHAGRVVGLTKLTHDIVRLTVALPANARYEFLPGQYSQVTFPGAASRDFSMASTPGEGLIEFFVRRLPGGEVTDKRLGTLAIGEAVSIKGPFGVAYLRELHIGPMIAVAGGSGLAPIRSIVRTALERGMKQPIRIYLGVRSERDIYLDAEFEQLCVDHPNISFTIVLSDPQPSSAYARGNVHEKVLRDLTGMDLGDWIAYVAGPPAMVSAVSGVVQGLGVQTSRCHADPFLTKADLAVTLR
ncbi:MAG TPA: 2Fe-2S iron-sulfur cluster-binding protein [Burkholderiales bacterium]|nr:2Fe-2S iron-sulfur cluster-binding protein [Burkholderiales bacterium]